MVFFIIFGFYILDFYMTLYILYPRSGAVYMPQVLPFNKMYNGIRSLFELAFTGSPSVIDLDTDFTQLNRMQMIDFCLWLFVYLIYIILALILLLNLLIAMLTFTFDAVREESTLQCRTSFAQRMMRLELLADSFSMQVNVGENKGEGNFTYDFRSIEGGGATADADDPFSNPDGGPLSRIELKLEKLEAEVHHPHLKPSIRVVATWRLSHAQLPAIPALLALCALPQPSALTSPMFDTPRVGKLAAMRNERKAQDALKAMAIRAPKEERRPPAESSVKTDSVEEL